MSVAGIASAYAGASAAQTQIGLGAAMLKMNADAANSIVAVLEQAQQNIAQQLANVTPGVGGNLDISV